jgi:hypothetical protein
VNTATGKVAALVAWAKVVLTQITEGFAVMIVTTCVIPILVPLFMYWMVKLLFQPTPMGLPALPSPSAIAPRRDSAPVRWKGRG